MQKTQWSENQIKELESCLKSEVPAYVRTKSLALINISQSWSISETARFLHCSRKAIYEWKAAFGKEGIKGLFVHEGRGRKPGYNKEEMELYLRQRPTNYGVLRQRWSLNILKQTVPCLKDYTLPGIWYALSSIGYSYKRGQPRVTSPDPLYNDKKKQ